MSRFHISGVASAVLKYSLKHAVRPCQHAHARICLKVSRRPEAKGGQTLSQTERSETISAVRDMASVLKAAVKKK